MEITQYAPNRLLSSAINLGPDFRPRQQANMLQLLIAYVILRLWISVLSWCDFLYALRKTGVQSDGSAYHQIMRRMPSNVEWTHAKILC